jgi:hypothetical protein
MANNKDLVNKAFSSKTTSTWQYIDSTFMKEVYQATFDDEQVNEMNFACARASEAIDRITGMAIGTDLSLLTDATNPATNIIVTAVDRIRYVCYATADMAWQIFQNGYDFGNGSISIGVGGMSASQVKLGNKTIDIPPKVYDFLIEALLYQRVTPAYMNLDPVGLLGTNKNSFYNVNPIDATLPDQQYIKWGEGKNYFSPQLVAGSNITLSTYDVGGLPKIQIDANLDPTILNQKIDEKLIPVNQNITNLVNADTTINQNITNLNNKVDLNNTTLNQKIDTTKTILEDSLNYNSSLLNNKIDGVNNTLSNQLKSYQDALNNPQLGRFYFEYKTLNEVKGRLIGSVLKTPTLDYTNLFNTSIMIGSDKFETGVIGANLNEPKTFTLLGLAQENKLIGGPIYFDIPNFFIAIGLESNTPTNRVSANPILPVNTTNWVNRNLETITLKYYNFNTTYSNGPTAPDYYITGNIPSLRPSPTTLGKADVWFTNNYTSLPQKLSDLVRRQYPQYIDPATNLIKIDDIAVSQTLLTLTFEFSSFRGSYVLAYNGTTLNIELTTTYTSYYSPTASVPYFTLCYFETKDASFFQVAPRVLQIQKGSGATPTTIISLDNSVRVVETYDGYDLSVKEYVDPAITNAQSALSVANTANTNVDTLSTTINDPVNGLATKTNITQVNQAIDTKQADYNLWGKEYVNNGKYAFLLDSTNNWQSIYNKTVSNFFEEDLNETIISNNNISILNKNIPSLPTKIFETKIERSAISQFVQNNKSNTYWKQYEIDRQTSEMTLFDSFDAWDLYYRIKTLEATRVRTASFINTASNTAFRINTPTTSNVPKIYNVTNLFFNNNTNPNYVENKGLIGPNGLLLYDNDNQKLIANPATTTGKEIQLRIELIHNNPSLTAGDAYSLAIGLSSVANGTTDTTLTIFDNGPIFKAETFISSLTLIPNKTYKETDDIPFVVFSTPTEQSRLNGFKICLINRNNTPYDFNNMSIVINATLGA